MFRMIIAIVGLVIFAYFLLFTFQPSINSLVETANASANSTTFPGTQEVIVGWPFWAYLVPAGLGIMAVIITLREGRR